MASISTQKPITKSINGPGKYVAIVLRPVPYKRYINYPRNLAVVHPMGLYLVASCSSRDSASGSIVFVM